MCRLGTAAWAKHVVDGDLLYEIDAREIPADWPYGLLPLGAKKPNDIAGGWTVDTIHYELNGALVDWAYALTKDHPVADSPGIARFRRQFAGYPAALRPPFVTIGDSLSSSRYWHGERMNQWANDWVKLQAGKDANFMMSNMEDSGTLTALRRLSRVGRVDLKRVLVLRTASNYSMPPPGEKRRVEHDCGVSRAGYPGSRGGLPGGKSGRTGLDRGLAALSRYDSRQLVLRRSAAVRRGRGHQLDEHLGESRQVEIQLGMHEMYVERPVSSPGSRSVFRRRRDRDSRRRPCTDRPAA